MIAFLKKFFKKLWQILVRIFSFAPYVYGLEQVYKHEKEKAHELEHEKGDEQSTEQNCADQVNVDE